MTLEIVINNLAEKEAQSRAKLVNTCMVKIVEAENKLKGASNPDVKFTDTSGTRHEGFSPKAEQAKIKAEQEVQRFTNALSQALNDDNWTPIKKCCSGGSSEQG